MLFDIDVHRLSKLFVDGLSHLLCVIGRPIFIRDDADQNMIDLALNDLKLMQPADQSNASGKCNRRSSLAVGAMKEREAPAIDALPER